MEVRVTVDEHRTEIMRGVVSVTLKHDKDLVEMRVVCSGETSYTYCHVPNSVLITHESCLEEKELGKQKEAKQ